MKEKRSGGRGQKSQKYFLSFPKNIKNLIKISSRVFCSERKVTSPQALLCLAAGNIATLRWQAADYIQINAETSFMPEDTQKQELNLAVRKTEVWTDKKTPHL